MIDLSWQCDKPIIVFWSNIDGSVSNIVMLAKFFLPAFITDGTEPNINAQRPIIADGISLLQPSPNVTPTGNFFQSNKSGSAMEKTRQ